MLTYGYNRSITRAAVNPRLAFGVPLDKLCPEGRLHPGLRDLFLKAHLCADSEGNRRLKRNQADDDVDVSHTVLKLLEPRENGLGTAAERLWLRNRLEAGEWIIAIPTSPGAPLGLLENFLGCLPNPIFGEKIWSELSEECKEYVEKAVTGSSDKHFLVQKLAKCLKQLSGGEFLTLSALLGLLRNLATDGRSNDLSKTAVMALIRYFVPSLVSRPFRSGVITSEGHQKVPLILFLCYYWPEIREECENLSQEYNRASKCSSLTNMQPKVSKIGQKKCMSLPNGVDKQRAGQQYLKQSFVKSSLTTDIQEKCIYLHRNKTNNNVIEHKPNCIWKPIFLEKEVVRPTICNDKKHDFKPASLFICTCCGICSEKVDQETQCDDGIPLYRNESSEDLASMSSSVTGNCGSERDFSDIFHASSFSSNTLCPCHFPERDVKDSYKNQNQNGISQSTSASHLLKDYLTSLEVPFSTKEASSMTYENDVKQFLREDLKVSTNTEKKTSFCTTMNDSANHSIKICNEIIRERNDIRICESSEIPVMHNGLKSPYKDVHWCTSPGKDENNPKIREKNDILTCESPVITLMHNGLKSPYKDVHWCTSPGKDENNPKIREKNDILACESPVITLMHNGLKSPYKDEHRCTSPGQDENNPKIRENNDILTCESPVITLMHNGLKGPNKGEHRYTVPGQGENNWKIRKKNNIQTSEGSAIRDMYEALNSANKDGHGYTATGQTIREKNNVPISESSAIRVMQDGLKRPNKGEPASIVSGQGENNPKPSYYKSTEYNQSECVGTSRKGHGEDDRCRTELLMHQNWKKSLELPVKQKLTVKKSKTYPLQSSNISKGTLATTSADPDDEHPRRASESSALPGLKKLRFKPKKWFREAFKHGKIKTSRRTSSSHEPDTSP